MIFQSQNYHIVRQSDITGICRQAGGRNLTAGAYRIQFSIKDCNAFGGFVYDAYTGWNSVSRIIIEEYIPRKYDHHLGVQRHHKPHPTIHSHLHSHTYTHTCLTHTHSPIPHTPASHMHSLHTCLTPKCLTHASTHLPHTYTCPSASHIDTCLTRTPTHLPHTRTPTHLPHTYTHTPASHMHTHAPASHMHTHAPASHIHTHTCTPASPTLRCRRLPRGASSCPSHLRLPTTLLSVLLLHPERQPGAQPWHHRGGPVQQTARSHCAQVHLGGKLPQEELLQLLLALVDHHRWLGLQLLRED